MAEDILFQGAAGPVGRSDLRGALEQAGIVSGDMLMLHSRMFSFGGLGDVRGKDELAAQVLDAFLERLGPEGTLLLPTFTFSFCRTGVFDRENTPSEMGFLTEAARKRPDAVRTGHPIYSVCAIGARVDLALDADTATCFGSGSIFDALHKASGAGVPVKFVAMGAPEPPAVITHVHYVEESIGVPYRYHKMFTGQVKSGGGIRPVEVDFYVRDMEAEVIFDGEACWRLWRDNSVGKWAALGDSGVYAADERSVYEATAAAIREKPDFLCRGGYRPGKGGAS